MRKQFGVEQFLDTESTSETRKVIAIIDFASTSAVIFVLLCLGYYLAIGELRPMARVFF